MNNLDYSNTDKEHAFAAVEVIHQAIDGAADIPPFAPLSATDLLNTMSVQSAMDILNKVCRTGNTNITKIREGLNQVGLTIDEEDNIIETAEELRRKESRRKKWADEIRPKELAALQYIGHDSGVDMNEEQKSLAGGLYSNVHVYLSTTANIADAEERGDQTMNLYHRLNLSILSVREMGVMWLEKNQSGCWGHPITHACRDVANAGSVLLKRVGKDDMQGAVWKRFHSSVEGLRDACLVHWSSTS